MEDYTLDTMKKRLKFDKVLPFKIMSNKESEPVGLVFYRCPLCNKLLGIVNQNTPFARMFFGPVVCCKTLLQ